jgi:hypothetical protein
MSFTPFDFAFSSSVSKFLSVSGAWASSSSDLVLLKTSAPSGSKPMFSPLLGSFPDYGLLDLGFLSESPLPSSDEKFFFVFPVKVYLNSLSDYSSESIFGGLKKLLYVFDFFLAVFLAISAFIVASFLACSIISRCSSFSSYSSLSRSCRLSSSDCNCMLWRILFNM